MCAADFYVNIKRIQHDKNSTTKTYIWHCSIDTTVVIISLFVYHAIFTISKRTVLNIFRDRNSGQHFIYHLIGFGQRFEKVDKSLLKVIQLKPNLFSMIKGNVEHNGRKYCIYPMQFSSAAAFNDFYGNSALNSAIKKHQR
ncbi:MAG: hypothetical protein MHMPM18_001005 [Marteilia pararefringens]